MARKTVNSISRGRAAAGARELGEMTRVRQSSEAQTRFQGEDLEKEIRTRPVPTPPARPTTPMPTKPKPGGRVPVPPMRPKRMAKGGAAKKGKK
jgi:hypothetical protein